MNGFVARLAAAWPPQQWCDVGVLVAVSGGADSVGLLRGLATIARAGRGGRLVVAHFNHALRPAADDDARFVGALAAQLELPVAFGRGGPLSTAGEGLEAAARAARYAFLENAAGRHAARYVVTAHTADDQAETILHRVLRGTGLAGLAGIPRARPLGHATLLRPLLDVRRADVLAYLAELHQPYCTDDTNDSRRHTRNRLRHDLLPQLARDYGPAVVDALLRLAGQAAEVQRWIAAEAQRLAETHVAADANAARVDCRGLASLPRHLVRELFVGLWSARGWPAQSMGFAEWDALAAMAMAAEAADAASARRHFPGRIEAAAERGVLTLRPLDRRGDAEAR